MFLSPISLEGLDGKSCMQGEYWARLKGKNGWEAHAFRMRHSTLLVLTKRFFRHFLLAYVPFGPQEDVSLSELSRQIAKCIDGHLFAIRYDLPYGSKSDASGLVIQRESVQPDATVVIDLREGYEEIRKGYHERARRALKRSAGKVEVSLWEGDAETFDAWYDVYQETGIRDGFSTRSKQYMTDVLSLRYRGTHAQLFVAKRDGAVVGGTILLENSNEAVYLFGASERMGDCTCSHALQDAMIHASADTHRERYDFFGVSGDNGRGSHLSSLDLFKTSFGGERMVRRPTCDWKADRFVYACYSLAEHLRYRGKRG